ncbi:MAG: NAD(P)H-binding protein [Gammaproteobacteria bacterium]
MSGSILITGATGSIGRCLVRLLAERGESVKAATRDPARYAGSSGAEPVTFDFDRPETYSDALAGVDRMVLMPRGLDLQPCATAIPLLEKAKASGVRHVVLLSGLAADQMVEYPGHYQLENWLLNSGLDYTFLRPTWLMSMLIRGLRFPRQPDRLCPPVGEARLSFIDSDDIAAVAAVCLTEPGHQERIYTLTSDQLLNFHDCAAIISKYAACEMHYLPATEHEMRDWYARAGLNSEEIDYMMWIFNSVRAGWYETVSPNVSELLGRSPVKLEQYVAKHAAKWRDSGQTNQLEIY